MNLDKYIIKQEEPAKEVKLTAEQKKIFKAIEQVQEYINSKELKPRGEVKLLIDKDEIKAYFNNIKTNKIVAIDTETTGLDIFNIRVCGLCLYTPNMPSVYIPVYHTDPYGLIDTRCVDENWLSLEFKQLIEDEDIKTIYHNAKYDLKVLKHLWNIDIDKSNIYWDTMIGAYILNENERAFKKGDSRSGYGLKPLHNKYIMKGTDTSKDYGDYFGKLAFNYVPLDIAVIYAANDTIKTYELYDFQAKYLNPDHNRKDFKKLYNVFKDVEMPLLKLLVDIELRGWKVDLNKTLPLGAEYAKKIDEAKANVDKELTKYYPLMRENAEIMRLTKGVVEDFNFNSSAQAKEFFYNILKQKSLKRGEQKCDKDHLKAWSEKLPICKHLLEYKELNKLYTTYIKKLPEVLNKQTGKVHSSFNSIATDTGRFSSSDPITKVNLQNIPSKGDTRIRQLFVADEGYCLIGGDFSAIEPRVLASMSGDANMRNAYETKLDLYCDMASKLYKVPYEECKEFRPDGSLNPEGKKRRSSIKSILLGIMYSRGAASIAEQMGIKTKEAEALIEDFYKEYPAVKKYMDFVVYKAETIGYTETKLGRKRRLPDMVKYKGNKDNTLYKNSFRKCLNAVIQGSSADIMKLTLINLYYNQELKDLGFQILATIHDEVIAQVPIENVVKARELMKKVMLDTGEGLMNICMSVDIETSLCWSGDNVSDEELIKLVEER